MKSRLSRPGAGIGCVGLALAGAIPARAQEIVELPAEDRMLESECEEPYRLGTLAGEDWEEFGEIQSVRRRPLVEAWRWKSSAGKTRGLTVGPRPSPRSFGGPLRGGDHNDAQPNTARPVRIPDAGLVAPVRPLLRQQRGKLGVEGGRSAFCQSAVFN